MNHGRKKSPRDRPSRSLAFQAHAVPECLLLGPRFEESAGGCRDGGEIRPKILRRLLGVWGRRESSRPPTGGHAAALSRRSDFVGIEPVNDSVFAVIYRCDSQFILPRAERLSRPIRTQLDTYSCFTQSHRLEARGYRDIARQELSELVTGGVVKLRVMDVLLMRLRL